MLLLTGLRSPECAAFSLSPAEDLPLTKYSKILFMLFMCAVRSRWILKVTAMTRKQTLPFVRSLIPGLHLLSVLPDNGDTRCGGGIFKLLIYQLFIVGRGGRDKIFGQRENGSGRMWEITANGFSPTGFPCFKNFIIRQNLIWQPEPMMAFTTFSLFPVRISIFLQSSRIIKK